MGEEYDREVKRFLWRGGGSRVYLNAKEKVRERMQKVHVAGCRVVEK